MYNGATGYRMDVAERERERQITEQNSTHACLTSAIPNFIIFDRMKDKLVVNTITEFERYGSGDSRVTDVTVLLCVLSKYNVCAPSCVEAESGIAEKL